MQITQVQKIKEQTKLNKHIHCIDLLFTKLDDTTLHHFPVQIITLSSTLTNTSKDRETT